MSAVLKPQSAPVPTVKLLINGKFVESQTKVWKDVVNPATQEENYKQQALRGVIGLARRFHRNWRNVELASVLDRSNARMP